jgi:hypothetical protein
MWLGLRYRQESEIPAEFLHVFRAFGLQFWVIYRLPVVLVFSPSQPMVSR